MPRIQHSNNERQASLGKTVLPAATLLTLLGFRVLHKYLLLIFLLFDWIENVDEEWPSYLFKLEAI